MRIVKDFKSFLSESALEITQDNADKAASILGGELANHLGKKEVGTNRGEMVDGFWQKLGRTQSGSEGLPWCMAFVYAMFDDLAKALGIKNTLVKTGGVMDHWGKADNEVKVKAEPKLVKPGMIFIKTRAGGGSGLGHTGIVTGVNSDGTFNSIDGNSSDSVKANKYNVGDMVGFLDYFVNARTPEFDAKISQALTGLASKAGITVIQNPGAVKSSGTVIDSTLISTILKKLKEKNFGQEDLKKYSGTATPSGKGAKFKSSSGEFPAENIKAIEKALDDHGVTNEFARKALLGVCSKEDADLSGEESYANTSPTRIRQVFGSRMANLSDDEINALKKDDDAFFEKVYGMDTKIGRSIGNDAPGDGAKYRGYGFNQITGKGEYKELQEYYEKSGSKLGSINIVENPKLLNRPDVAAEFAVLYFLRRFPEKKIDVNGFTDLESAVRAFVQANAGWGSNINSGITAEGYAKALAFAQGLSTTGAAETTA